MAFFLFQNTPNVFEQFRPIFFDERLFPVFGTEDNLIQDLCVGTHKRVFFVQPVPGCEIMLRIPRIASGAIQI